MPTKETEARERQRARTRARLEREHAQYQREMDRLAVDEALADAMVDAGVAPTGKIALARVWAS